MSGRDTPSPSQLTELRGFDAFELRLGDVMRGERATLGKSLIDVQRELKIKAAFIAAIENADPTAFDTPGFIAGYVRSYSRYLGLDQEWAWQAFCREAGFQQPHGMSSAASAPKPARKVGLAALGDPNASFVPRSYSFFEEIELRAIGSFAVLVVLIGALGYGAWNVLQEVQRVQMTPVDSAPGAVASIGALPSEAPMPDPDTALVAGAGIGLPGSEVYDRLYRPPALDVPVMIARDGPISAVDPGSVGVLANPGAEASQAETTPQVVAEAVPGIFIVAVQPAWVEVTAADGTLLFQQILKPGERWEVPATEEPPFLKTGNAGATYFEVNGTPYGPVAPGRRVVRNVVLSAASLSETYLAADVASDPSLSEFIPVAEAPSP